MRWTEKKIYKRQKKVLICVRKKSKSKRKEATKKEKDEDVQEGMAE